MIIATTITTTVIATTISTVLSVLVTNIRIVINNSGFSSDPRIRCQVLATYGLESAAREHFEDKPGFIFEATGSECGAGHWKERTQQPVSQRLGLRLFMAWREGETSDHVNESSLVSKLLPGHDMRSLWILTSAVCVLRRLVWPWAETLIVDLSPSPVQSPGQSPPPKTCGPVG